MFKQVIPVAIILAAIASVIAWLTKGKTMAILQPHGLIADQQRSLLFLAVILALLVVIPVFSFTIYVACKYRASNSKANYQPEWNFSLKLSTGWWVIMATIIGCLAVVAWHTTHVLDPHRPITTNANPLTIQVVALQWKWLFIYPDQNIATVNYLALPTQRPINFQLTADAPMNSFWIPQLGGQMYAMQGMVTQLHLLANQPGQYQGSAAEISGAGFAGMRFKADAKTEDDFDQWVMTVKATTATLDMNTYNSLAKPSEDYPVSLFSSHQAGLYDMILMKFMSPMGQSEQPVPSQSDAMKHMSGMY